MTLALAHSALNPTSTWQNVERGFVRLVVEGDRPSVNRISNLSIIGGGSFIDAAGQQKPYQASGMLTIGTCR